MATDEEKARNKRLREEAANAKFARDTRQTPNLRGESPQHLANTAANALGGMSGQAVDAIRKHKSEIEDAAKQ